MDNRVRRWEVFSTICALLLLHFCLCSSQVSLASPEVSADMVGPFPLACVAGAQPDFTLAVLPDTQVYTLGVAHFLMGDTLTAQTQWLVANRERENIVYVAHVGDVVQFGDVVAADWQRAAAAMYRLETPLPGFPDGIPYGIAVGNHDMFMGTQLYNRYFGVERFQERAYYGGYWGDNNNNHFDLFEVGTQGFIVLYLEYARELDAEILKWANEVLQAYADRYAIIVSHQLIRARDAAFYSQGQRVYNALKDNPNVGLMLCGHNAGESFRLDIVDNYMTYTMMADYTARPNGGNGWLRLLRFSPDCGQVHVQTYSPLLDMFDTGATSDFFFSLTLRP